VNPVHQLWVMIIGFSQALEDLTAQYDYTVRNSVGGIVQFQYGDDRLDPAELEGEAVPVAFPRTWSHALVSGMRLAVHKRPSNLLVS
jgi:hypothetical protein